MTAQRLRDVDWNAAVAAAERLALSSSSAGRSHAASALSLSALFTLDSRMALRRVKQASTLEPLNPLHEFRRALLLVRCGQLEPAAEILDRLRKTLPESPTLEYIRGVVALRSGKPKVARTIADSIAATHPMFVLAKFLKAEAQLIITNKVSTLEKYLQPLPAAAEYETLWADLLVKMAILFPRDGANQAKKYLDKNVRREAPSYSAVERAIDWAKAFADEGEKTCEQQISLGENLLRAVSPNSLSEELVLTCLVQRLTADGTDADAVQIIGSLRRKFPERPAIGSIYHMFLTRIAVQRASSGDYEHALRIVERCLWEQPHDEAHYLNRAAIFTLLRKRREAYYQSWGELSRHHYRLILLGTFDIFIARQAAQMHRVFAQQARIEVSPKSGDSRQRCIFRTYVDRDDGDRMKWRINEDEIAADPELLRQWIYHTQAELVFAHFLIGDDADKLLLHPADRDEGHARARALCSHADALGVLVPEEGGLLATKIAERWRGMSAEIRVRYPTHGKTSKDVAALARQHLLVLGDLSLLCRQWQPSAQQLGLAEELLQFILAERAFFAEDMLEHLHKEVDREAEYPILILMLQARNARENAGGKPLSAAQRGAAIDALAAELLVCMAYSALDVEGGMRRAQVMRSLALIDRARQCDGRSASVELAAAEILVLGDFFDEARSVLDRFHRLVDPEEKRMLDRADRVDKILAEKRKEQVKGRSSRERLAIEAANPSDNEDRRRRIEELERELDRSPRAWKPYEDIVHELAKAERFDDAVAWADRAVAHCLTRAGQMNARALAIEARGLALLAESNPRGAYLMAAGVAEPARKAIEALEAPQRDNYAIVYLLGKCQLAVGQPALAQRSFATALEACERQLHRGVLRHLAEDIDNAYLAVARIAVSEALDEGRTDEAIGQAAAVFGRLEEPAAWVVDFARVLYSAVLARLGTANERLSLPPIALSTDWSARFDNALHAPHDAERARALATLAVEVHPPSREAAQALQERIEFLIRQIRAAEALNSAGALLTARKFEEVLAFLTTLDADVIDEPRFLRVRVLALLGMERFEEAEALVKIADPERFASVRDFVKDYPQLVFRHRLATAHRLLSQGKASDAIQVLAAALPTSVTERADLAYCNAYGLALQAYGLRQRNRDEEAHELFARAADQIEPHLNAGSDINRFRELYDRLEKELEHGRI